MGKAVKEMSDADEKALAHLRLALVTPPNAYKSLGSRALIDQTPSKRQRANMKRDCKPSAVLLRQNRKQNAGGGDVSFNLFYVLPS